MATKIPSMTVVAVDASNKVLGAGGTAGTEVRQRQVILRAVSSGGKVIESNGTAGSVDANPPVAAVRVVDASNAILNSAGNASASAAIPDTVAMFVGSDNVGYGSSGSGVPVMDVHIVDETSTLLDALFGGGAGTPSTTSYENFIARTTGLDAAHDGAYKQLFYDLETAGLFNADGTTDYLDALYILATDTTTNALLNLVSSSFALVPINSPTFAADLGYTGADTDTAVPALNTQIHPATGGGQKYTFGAAHMSAWSNTDNTDAVGGILAGVGNSSFTAQSDLVVNQTLIRVRIDEDSTIGFNTGGSTPGGDSRGFITGNRSGSGASEEMYWNGSAVTFTPVAIASGASNPANAERILIGAFGVDTAGSLVPRLGTAKQIMAASVGGSLTATQALNLYNAVHTYLQTIAGIAY